MLKIESQPFVLVIPLVEITYLHLDLMIVVQTFVIQILTFVIETMIFTCMEAP